MESAKFPFGTQALTRIGVKQAPDSVRFCWNNEERSSKSIPFLLCRNRQLDCEKTFVTRKKFRVVPRCGRGSPAGGKTHLRWQTILDHIAIV